MEFSEAVPFLESEHSAVVTTIGRAGGAQATIVRAGPFEGRMGFVVRGDTAKRRNLERNPSCTVLTVQPDWRRFATVEGQAELRGPENTEAEELRLLLRAVFVAAGGSHSDWDEYDRVMRDEGRVVVLVTPERIYGRV
jgi:PPOX class probable F420-dependent enzyme